jgi:hypothetical protein
VARDDVDEGLRLDRVDLRVGARRDRRRAGQVREQRDLADALAAAVPGDPGPTVT